MHHFKRRPADGSIELLLASLVTNTPVGTAVATSPADPKTGATPVSLTFTEVSAPGATLVSASPAGPPPSGFQLGDPAVYHEIQSNASFIGPVSVCISYAGVTYQNESLLRLLHYEEGTWVDRTVSVDTSAKVVCASVNSFSPFAVFEEARSGHGRHLNLG